MVYKHKKGFSMKTLSKNHPELQDGEVFLTNASDDHFPRLILLHQTISYRHSSWESIGWRTKRKGVIAYDIYGKQINGMFPVFVQKEELINGGINPDILWDK